MGTSSPLQLTSVAVSTILLSPQTTASVITILKNISSRRVFTSPLTIRLDLMTIDTSLVISIIKRDIRRGIVKVENMKRQSCMKIRPK